MVLKIFFFIYPLLSIFSIIGFGKLFIKLFLKNQDNTNLAVTGIFGLFLLFIISFTTHVFIQHNYLHNLILYITGIFLFLIYFKKINKKQLRTILIIFIVLFTGFIIAKTNEDFPYYHLPVTLQIVQNKLTFGLGNIDVAYNHFSSIFFINSLYYLPFIDYYIFNLTSFLFQIFFFSYLIFSFKKNKNNFLRFFICSTFLIFILKFYRLSEYGVDMPGQFLTIIGTIMCLIFLLQEKNKKNDCDQILIFLYIYAFAITTKFLYVIYLLFPLIILFYKIGLYRSIYLIKNYRLLLVGLFSFLSIIIFNFSSSGCFLYPLKYTCFFTELDWTLSSKVIDDMGIHYEAWAKAGKGPNFQVENLKNYVSGLNWIKNWFNVYFISKVSDFIFINFLLFFIFFLIFFKKFSIKKNSTLKNNFILLYSIIILIFIYWFFNFPTLRYAGYSIVFQLIYFPLCYYLSKRINLNQKPNIIKIYILIVISIIVFNSRNVHRISDELKTPRTMNHNFSNFPLYWVKNPSYNKLNSKLNYISEGRFCWNVPSICVRGKEIKFFEEKGYTFLYR